MTAIIIKINNHYGFGPR